MRKVKGEHIYLRILQEEDVYRFTQMLIQNRVYWSLFEPRFSASYYTIDAQRERIQRSLQQYEKGREYNFGIFERATDRLVGHLSLYEVKRLPFSSAFVGYSMDERFSGKGYATEAVRLSTRYAFRQLKLHRIEAYVSPRNTGSIRVLENNYFRREGLLKQLIYINGTWEDHYLYALLESEWYQ